MLTKILLSLSTVTILTCSVFANPKSTDVAPQVNSTTLDASKTLDKKDLEVIIYSSKNCSYCTSVKEVFDEKKIKFTEINVDNNAAKLKELEDKTGKKTVPQVIINGKHVGSYLDIVWGDVDEMLKNSSENVKK